MTTLASATIRDLDLLRRKHGADSDIGFACSNPIEQIKSLQHETEPAARANLSAAIERSQEHLARSLSDAQ